MPEIQLLIVKRIGCTNNDQNPFSILMKELAYSGDQACRRINTMRTSKSLPEVKEKLDNGTITLTTWNFHQSFHLAHESKISNFLNKK